MHTQEQYSVSLLYINGGFYHLVFCSTSPICPLNFSRCTHYFVLPLSQGDQFLVGSECITLPGSQGMLALFMVYSAVGVGSPWKNCIYIYIYLKHWWHDLGISGLRVLTWNCRIEWMTRCGWWNILNAQGNLFWMIWLLSRFVFLLSLISLMPNDKNFIITERSSFINFNLSTPISDQERISLHYVKQTSDENLIRELLVDPTSNSPN